VRVKKAPTEKQIAAIRVAAEKKTKKTERVEFNEKAKAYRLEQLKEVSERMKKIEGERDQMYAEMEEYENEAMKYVREHAPAFLRKELNLL
jgi:vacuolar-type H+-ATPase subunit I/STV1